MTTKIQANGNGYFFHFRTVFQGYFESYLEARQAQLEMLRAEERGTQ